MLGNWVVSFTWDGKPAIKVGMPSATESPGDDKDVVLRGELFIPDGMG